MADNKLNINENVETAENAETPVVDTENIVADTEAPEQNDALKSFLDRDNSAVNGKKSDKKPKKLSRSALWVIIGAVAVILIVGVILLLRFLPTASSDEDNIDYGTEINLTVDEDGEHQATLVFNDKGELDNNSYGTLIEYTPSDIKQIDVENESGTYTVLSETPVEVDEETGEETTGATIYTLVGYEDIELISGGPDTIADDVAAIAFTSVADPTGENASDFGFDNPRATVKTQFTDGTTSTIIVGDDAPSELGTYLMFGDSKSVYVVETAAVDGFLFSVLDLVTLTVNDSAADADSAEFETLKLSGTAYGDTIEIRPNDDQAIDSSYVMISPDNMFISEVEAASISGAIRGLYADEAICVNPSSAQLSQYGLSTPYAQVTAVYSDTTVHLKASEPKDDSVYLIADSNIIYKIAASYVPWVYTTYDKLRPDVVIDPNFDALTQIVVTDASGTYTFDITTVTETVTNTDGEEEEVESTTATYNGEKLDSDNFRVLYQNIGNMQNAGSTDSKPSGTPALTIKLSYSTGRATDTIAVYPTGNTKYIATLNGNVQCLVYKSYCTKFSQCVQDLITGKTVSSF